MTKENVKIQQVKLCGKDFILVSNDLNQRYYDAQEYSVISALVDFIQLGI